MTLCMSKYPVPHRGTLGISQPMTRHSVTREPNKIDGRALRSERSRQLIADTLYELIGEGDLEPSAQRVADRAGIGIRTVFRHFDDMDALYATVNRRLEAESAPLLGELPDPDADQETRARNLVAKRAVLFERFGPYMRATNRHRSRSKFLSDRYRKMALTVRQRLLLWLPELKEARPELLEAMDLVTSFDAWDRLRIDQRLPRRRAEGAMLAATLALLAQARGPA